MPGVSLVRVRGADGCAVLLSRRDRGDDPEGRDGKHEGRQRQLARRPGTPCACSDSEDAAQ